MEWKQIPSRPKYEASSTGEIRNPKNPDHMLVGGKAANGRRIIRLPDAAGKYKTDYVHRLICEAFHGVAPADKPWALHRDDVFLNNHKDNLYWGTPFDNASDKTKNGIYLGHPGELSGTAKLTWDKVRKIRRLKALGERTIDIAKQFEVSSSCVSNIIAGRLWVETADQI